MDEAWSQAAASFPPELWARGARWGFVRHTSQVAELVVDVALVLALCLSPAGRRLHDRCAHALHALDGGRPAAILGAGWASGALFVGLVMLLRELAALPFVLWRDWFEAHALGLSTETVGRFAGTSLRGALGGAVAFALVALILPAVRRRWPRSWWLTVGVAGALVLVVDAAADPYRTRLDYQLTPLPDGALRSRILGLAAARHVEVGALLVVDTSRDSPAMNAFVMGTGPTLALVLTDTLVAMGDEAAAGAAAHELGHRHAERMPIRLAWAGLGLVGLLGLLELVVRRGRSLGCGSDAQALPLVLVAITLATTLVLPVRAAFGRAEEREADALELDTRRDYDAYIAEQVRLAAAAALEPDPPAPWRWLSDHPSPIERVAEAIRRRDGIRVLEKAP